MKKTGLKVLALVLCLAFLSPEILAFQQANDADDAVEMIVGYKMKTKVNKSLQLNADVTVDEDSNSGSVSVGVSTEYGSVIKYCKPRRSKQCPKKYL